MQLLRDLRYSCRTLRKNPIFTSVAVLTLALGIGANTVIFSLVNTVLLRPLPFPEPDRLVFIWEDTAMFGLKDSVASLANYADWRAQNHVFQQMGALESRTYRLTAGGEAIQVIGSTVTGSLFATLGVRPALGRLFREDEDRPGTARVAILSDGLWHRAYGGDPRIVGSTISINDENYEVVGVMQTGFRFPDSDNDLWTPIGTAYGLSEWSNRGRHNFMAAARLKTGVTLEQANQEIRAIAQRLERQYPMTNHKVGAFVAPMRDHFVAEARPMLWVLLGAVGFVLLIGCANVANLLLARAANRRREMAIRIAVGASRGAIVRQLMTENLMVAAAGGVCALALAFLGVRFLEKLVPSGIAAVTALSVDARVLGYTLAISIAAGLVFGLAPAIRSVKADLQRMLRQGGDRNTGTRRSMDRALVVLEVALALVLAIGAGLMVQTFARLRGSDPGFRTKDILSVRLAMRTPRTPEQRAAFYEEVLRRVTALPGVVSAGFSNGVPLAYKGDINGFTVEGQPPVEGRFNNANYRIVTTDYLRTLAIPLRQGRGIEVRDSADAPPVMVINEAMRRKFWPHEDPIGKRIRFSSERPWITVVGMVADIRQTGLDAPAKEEMYLPAVQQQRLATWLAIRTQVDPAKLAAAVRRSIRSSDTTIPIAAVSTMDEILDREVFQRRVQMILLTAFAGLALLLASIGVYGVLAYLVSQRTQEIGIRMALGAAPRDLARSVLGEGICLGVAGIGVGILTSLAVTRVLSKLLFGVTPTDPITFISVAVLLLAVTLTASYIPARRAMKVDPILALRQD